MEMVLERESRLSHSQVDTNRRIQNLLLHLSAGFDKEESSSPQNSKINDFSVFIIKSDQLFVLQPNREERRQVAHLNLTAAHRWVIFPSRDLLLIC